MLSVLTQPNFPKSAIGLERDSVTALEVQKEGRGQFGLRQAATLELPPKLIVPSFLEKNINNADELRFMLTEVCQNAGLMNNKRWSVSLPANTGRSAILTLDTEPASSKELEDILDWRSEQSFGAPAGELRIAREKIAPDREGKTRYFASAVKLSVIDEYETIFESLGWKAGLILPRAVCESKWLLKDAENRDSLLLSAQNDGFTALLLRDGEPRVVRSVTCTPQEIDDEIYRLLMFYNDRFGDRESAGFLNSLLVIGRVFDPVRIKAVSAEAFGRTLEILRPSDVGFTMPNEGISFHDLAAPGGLAVLGYR